MRHGEPSPSHWKSVQVPEQQLKSAWQAAPAARQPPPVGWQTSPSQLFEQHSTLFEQAWPVDRHPVPLHVVVLESQDRPQQSAAAWHPSPSSTHAVAEEPQIFSEPPGAAVQRSLQHSAESTHSDPSRRHMPPPPLPPLPPVPAPPPAPASPPFLEALSSQPPLRKMSTSKHFQNRIP